MPDNIPLKGYCMPLSPNTFFFKSTLNPNAELFRPNLKTANSSYDCERTFVECSTLEI